MIDLGPRTATGKADTTGQNPGNYTVVFDPAAIGTTPSRYEIYKMIVSGPAGSEITSIKRDNALWDVAAVGDLNSWDPNQALPMNDGNTLFYFWSAPSSATPAPTVTIWLRFDETDPANRDYVRP